MEKETALEKLQQAVASEKLTASAEANIRRWLLEPHFAAYVDRVLQDVAQERWQALDDAFWTVIPFGTGGRRGRMYPIGTNAINERTMGESAQGLATYVRQQHEGRSPLACAVAYDTRHRSIEFSRLCAEVMVANGFRVYYLEDHRSTPELSFLVRWKRCSCGIMVTASHNPPSDNAIKAYWSTGGQLLPPHDQGVIDCVMSVEAIERVDFDQAVAAGQIIYCLDETDAAYQRQLLAQAHSGPRQLRVIYSPLHGVGTASICPALHADGFRDVELFGPHAAPDGDFPNVPNHVSNPENREVFEAIIERGRQIDADLILATDPDCDRLGCAAPIRITDRGSWHIMTGNQIAALLADYVLQKKKEAGELTPDHYLVKTLVTSEMVRRVGESYGVRTIGNLPVGFKWIGGTMDAEGPERFVMGAEESHGYLVGQHARDKDGAVAAMLLSELAAECKARGLSLCEKLEALFWQHGYHAEQLATQTMTGSQGMLRMQSVMTEFRQRPPEWITGLRIRSVRDYLRGVTRRVDGSEIPLDGPVVDMVMIDFEEQGNYVAVRPSGTEPKIKYYAFAYVPAEQLADLRATQEAMSRRLAEVAAGLCAFADSAP